MNRLSALDSFFLYAETPKTPMHVASVTIFKPKAPRDDVFEAFRAHTAARLDLLPSYRRKLKSTPLGIDHPAWVTADVVDLDHHVRHALLPQPGGMEELRALVAELHARPLDRSRPLWEYHLIEGLEDGAFAVYMKVHHSAMDGLAGMATLGVAYDLTPEAEEPQPRPATPPDAGPADALELTSTAVADFIRQGVRAVTGLRGMAQALLKAAPHLARDAKLLYAYVKDMPRTPLNGAISGRRVFATTSLSLPRVKALSKARHVTINDVVLALSAGALRRYLAEKGALPSKPLTAGVPASIRDAGDSRLNNQVVFTLSQLPTDVADPLERLAAAKIAGSDAKALFADFRDLVTTDVSLLGAPVVITALMRLWSGARIANHARSALNVVISNVPGPRAPFYCVGAPAIHYFPASIAFHGAAVNITVQSYCDTLDFGLVACAETVPDAQTIADYVAEDFAAMETAAAKAGPLKAPDTAELLAKLAAKLSSGSKAAALAPLAREPAAKAPPPEPSPLSRNIDALGAATKALLRKLDERRAAPASRRKPAPPAEPKTKAARGKATGSKAASKTAAAKAKAATAKAGAKPRRAPARKKARVPAKA